VTQSLAGGENANRVASRDAARKKSPAGILPPPVKEEDRLDLKTDGNAGPEAARRLRGNADEETSQDRRENPAYSRGPKRGQGKPGDPKARIDLQG